MHWSSGTPPTRLFPPERAWDLQWCHDLRKGDLGFPSNEETALARGVRSSVSWRRCKAALAHGQLVQTADLLADREKKTSRAYNEVWCDIQMVGQEHMKVFKWTGVAPDDGIALEPGTKHGAPTHAVCIRYVGGDQLEITYFTGLGSTRKTVSGTRAVMIVPDSEGLGPAVIASKREVPRGENGQGG